MIDVPVPCKVLLMLTQELKAKVEKEFGWPVYAVAPGPDFSIYFQERAVW